ncbi:MAG: hypothetical protein EBZ05_09075 [Verrucomicrobia bacterium]|nr:hypothetical protein [Verrucomicrobiota bacterium]
MKEMRMAIALWAGLCLSLFAQQQEDKTAGGAVKEVPVKKTEVDSNRADRTVAGSSQNSKGNNQVQQAVSATPEEEQARSAIVAMANRGWDVVNPASPNKPVYSEVIQEKGTAPTFSNNMMDSPDGSQRMNDGWKLFGWTY